MEKKNTESRWALAFSVTTAALLLFGILMQLLCEGMGYERSFGRYMLGLLGIGAIFALVYGAAVHFRKLHKVLRVVLIVLLILTILWTALGALNIGITHLAEEQFIVYKIYAWTYPVREVEYMLERSRLFGYGEPYYKYPDACLEGYAPYQEDIPLDAFFGFDERQRAEAVFGNYRAFRTLPVLSYTYGLWVNWVYALLTAAWCVAAAGALFRLRRWWEVLLWLLFSGFFATLQLLPLLGAFGCINDWVAHPFSAHMLANATYVAPQLGILFALQKK